MRGERRGVQKSEVRGQKSDCRLRTADCRLRVAARVGAGKVVPMLVIVGLAGCPQGGSRAELGTLPSQVVESFILHETLSGERLYTLEAETAYVYEAEQRVDVALPRVRFYDAGTDVRAVLVARRGVILSQTGDLVAYDEVVVRTADSTVLHTDSLRWNNHTRVVRTDAPVLINTPTGTVSGTGLVSDAGLSRIEIQSEVRGSSSYRFSIGRPDSVEGESVP